MRLKKYKTKKFSAVDYRSFGNGRKSRFHIFSFESFGSNYNPNRIKYKTCLILKIQALTMSLSTKLHRHTV